MMDERGWSEYRLAKECGVSQSTISNIFNRNYQPSISSLESICRSFGITLSQFFAEGRLVELTEDQKAALLGLAGRYAVLAGPRTEEESV